jgi:hypothetical protein
MVPPSGAAPGAGTAPPGATPGAGGPAATPARPMSAAFPAAEPMTSAPTAASASAPAATGGSPAPTVSASPTGQSAQGTVTVTPTTIVLTPLLGGSLRLTAGAAAVTWSISEPASLVGELSVVPAAGTLAAGQSVTVTITVSGLASLDTRLTVSPGGQRVTVLLGVG